MPGGALDQCGAAASAQGSGAYNLQTRYEALRNNLQLPHKRPESPATLNRLAFLFRSAPTYFQKEKWVRSDGPEPTVRIEVQH